MPESPNETSTEASRLLQREEDDGMIGDQLDLGLKRKASSNSEPVHWSRNILLTPVEQIRGMEFSY